MRTAFLITILTLLVTSCGTGKLRYISTKSTKTEVVNNKSAEVLRNDIQPINASLDEPNQVESFDDVASIESEILIGKEKEDPIFSSIDRNKSLSASRYKSSMGPKPEPPQKERIFKEATFMFLISSGTMIVASIALFLGFISIYFPAVGVVLCIAGFYFFFRGLAEYRWSRDKLKYQPPEYAKEQKAALVTTLMIFNIALLCLGIVGILGIIF